MMMKMLMMTTGFHGFTAKDIAAAATANQTPSTGLTFKSHELLPNVLKYLVSITGAQIAVREIEMACSKANVSNI